MADFPKMTSYFTKQQKKQKIQSNNPVEIIKDFGFGVVKSAVNDVAGGIIKNAGEQIGFIPSGLPQVEGSLTPDNTNLKEEKSPESSQMFFGEKQPFRPYAEKTYTERDIEVQQKIQEILRELKSLAKSVEAVNKEVAKITVEQIPQNGGTYHLNFFEWVLKIIKLARAKVSESALWLSTFQSRKAKKGYWQMFKKHGTSFALSSERALASSMG